MLRSKKDQIALEALASEPKRRALIAKYHSMLEKVDLPEFASNLQTSLRAHRVFYGDRCVCDFLRPTFVTKEQVRLISSIVRPITLAMQTLAGLIVKDEELQKFIDVTFEEKQLLEIEPGFPGFSITSRLDGFLNGGNLGFVEYNAESPAGIGYSDSMTQAFLSVKEISDFARENNVEPLWCAPSLLNALLKCWQQWGGKEKPVIAIVDFLEVPTHHEFYILQQSFKEAGYDTIVADPRKLEYKDGKLLSEGKAVDLVYRRVLTSEYIEHQSEEIPLLEAYRDGKICLVNSFRSKILHKKSIFALLTDPTYQKYFTPEQVDCINCHVPWTRKLKDTVTTQPITDQKDSHKECQLLDYVRKNREQLVLKPNDSYGGRGIFLGWECTQSQWEEHVNTALSGNYLVQERIPVEREMFPIWSQGKFSMVEYTLDFDPFVFDFDLSGICTRLSVSGLCNVTAGGGSAPCFMVS